MPFQASYTGKRFVITLWNDTVSKFTNRANWLNNQKWYVLYNSTRPHKTKVLEGLDNWMQVVQTIIIKVYILFRIHLEYIYNTVYAS